MPDHDKTRSHSGFGVDRLFFRGTATISQAVRTSGKGKVVVQGHSAVVYPARTVSTSTSGKEKPVKKADSGR
ncbi:MAG: hypothetical protein D6740_00035 [Alphaproteobacteria bacterium]|nr:MAG: hypothetical protein D6740_00035 [Alphaproteobacteria bacterium]